MHSFLESKFEPHYLIYIHDLNISQNQLLAIAKKLAPNKTLEPYHDNTADMLMAAREKIAAGDYSPPVMFEFILVSVFGESYGGKHASDDDNKLLGIAGDKTDADIETILRPLFA